MGRCVNYQLSSLWRKAAALALSCPPGRPPTPRATPVSIYDPAPSTTFITRPLLLFRLISCLCRRDNDLLLLVGVIILLPPPPSSHAVGQCTLFRRIILLPPPRTDRSSSIVIIVTAAGTRIAVPSLLCSSGSLGRIVSEEGRSSVAIIVHRGPTTTSRHRILRLQCNGGRKRQRISCHGGRRSAQVGENVSLLFDLDDLDDDDPTSSRHRR